MERNVLSHMTYSKWIQLLCVALVFLIGLFFSSPAADLNNLQWKTLLLLVISIFLWSRNLLPLSVSSLLIIAIIMFFNLANSFSSAISGFLVSAIYFVIIVSMISKVMVRVGLDKVIASYILRISSGNIRRVVLSFIAASMIIPVLMPSAVARYRMFHPLVDSLNNFYKLSDDSAFRRFSVWLFSGLNQFLTMIVLTGGGYSILSAELLSDDDFSIDWVSWFLHMAPPIYLAAAITIVLAFFYFGVGSELRKHFPGKEKMTSNLPDIIFTELTIRYNRKAKFVSIVLMLMLIAWILGSRIGLPAILPPIIVLTLFSLPGIHLFSDKDVRHFEWETFIFIGSALSLSNIVQQTGTADRLANLLFNGLSQDLPSIMSVLFLMAMVILIRLLLTSPTGAIAVILPLTVTFGSSLGLPVLGVSLLTILVVGSFIVLPIYSNTTIIAFQSGVLTIKDHIILGFILLMAVMFTGLLSFYYLW